MSRGEVARVLAAMALIDKRTVDENDIRMWYGLIPGDVTVEEAVQGIRLYYQQHTKPMMPAQLIQFARMAKPDRRDVGHYGEPGEILCPKCRGVHYPHEDCSVLVPMPAWFRARFAAHAKAASSGIDPGDLFKVPEDV